MVAGLPLLELHLGAIDSLPRRMEVLAPKFPVKSLWLQDSTDGRSQQAASLWKDLGSEVAYAFSKSLGGAVKQGEGPGRHLFKTRATAAASFPSNHGLSW